VKGDRRSTQSPQAGKQRVRNGIHKHRQHFSLSLVFREADCAHTNTAKKKKKKKKKQPNTAGETKHVKSL
jgi:hypothetical protein